MKYNDIFSFREGLGKVFDIKEYPVQGKLYLKNNGKIVIKALAQLMIDGSFNYTINKFPKEIFNNKESEDVKKIHITANKIPLLFSWEFIPMNLGCDIIKGNKNDLFYIQ